MSLSPEQLRYIAEYTASVIGKINQVLANRITTTFTNSNDVIPSSKLVKDEFAAVRSEMPTNTSDLTNDGADGTNAFIVEGDSRLDDTRNPKPHNQASSTITDTNTYSNIGNTLQNQASINSAINEKIGALINLDLIEQVTTRPTASADTLNKIYAVPEDDPTSENLFQYFVTVYENNAYKWDKIDIAKIDLSDYVKKNNIDTTLIQSSANPVSGGAVYTAIENAKTSINNNLAAVATSGSYNDLTNKPSIPTKTSDLTNDNEFITENNIDDALDEFLKQSAFVSSNKSIIQSGENSILTARIFGIPSIQNIEFYEKKENGSSILLDTIPLNNGIATYNYIGSGAGKKQFYIKSGSIQSEIYEVMDTIKYDNGTDSTHNIWNSVPSNTILNYGEEYATFTKSVTGNKYLSTSFTNSGDVCFEFDFYQAEGYRNSRFLQISDSTNTTIYYASLQDLGMYDMTWNSIKIEFIRGKIYVNGVDTTKTYSSNPSTFFFALYGSEFTELRFKNLKIYQI